MTPLYDASDPALSALSETSTTTTTFPIKRNRAKSTTIFGMILVVVSFVPPIVVLTMFLSRGAAYFELTTEGLSVRRSLYGRTIPWNQLDLDNARLISSAVDHDYHPANRLNGSDFFGSKEGWYRLRNGEKALIFLAQVDRAILIPTTNNYLILATPEQPEAALAALRARRTPYRIEMPHQGLSPTQSPLMFLFAAAMLITAALPLLIMWFTWRTLTRATVELAPDGLRIKAKLYGKQFPWRELLVENAGFVNIKTDPEFAVKWKRNGIQLPGVYIGSFTLKNKQKAFLFVTDPTTAICIPTTNQPLILSPETPDTFFEQLQQYRNAPH